MMMGSFLFKQKAREALKGRWQNTLVVSFFSGVFLTIAQVAQTVALKDVQAALNSLQVLMGTLGAELTNTQSQQVLELYQKLFQAIGSIPQSTYTLLIALNAVALLVTPMLMVGCNHYFTGLVRGHDAGVVDGLLGRVRIWVKAVWLYARMFVQIALWSLLLVIPGIIAALRYSMAPYYLAEDPSISAGEALRRSKEAMKEKGRKMSYFMLLISFVGWSLLISIAQLVLGGMLGTVMLLVASQFMSLALTTYVNASCAAFFHAVSTKDGLNDLFDTIRRRMKQAGISDHDIHAAGFGQPDDDLVIDEEEEEADGGDDE